MNKFLQDILDDAIESEIYSDIEEKQLQEKYERDTVENLTETFNGFGDTFLDKLFEKVDFIHKKKDGELAINVRGTDTQVFNASESNLTPFICTLINMVAEQKSKKNSTSVDFEEQRMVNNLQLILQNKQNKSEGTE